SPQRVASSWKATRRRGACALLASAHSGVGPGRHGPGSFSISRVWFSSSLEGTGAAGVRPRDRLSVIRILRRRALGREMSRDSRLSGDYRKTICPVRPVRVGHRLAGLSLVATTPATPRALL